MLQIKLESLRESWNSLLFKVNLAYIFWFFLPASVNEHTAWNFILKNIFQGQEINLNLYKTAQRQQSYYVLEAKTTVLN